MSADGFRKMLEEWIADFRAEALRQLDAGASVNDVMRIAGQVADSRQTRKAIERQRAAAPIEIAHGRLPPH